jgi:hypothetical protein
VSIIEIGGILSADHHQPQLEVTLMKKTNLILAQFGILVGGVALLVTPVQAAQGGTDILHLVLHKAASPTELASNAVGRIELRQNRQGHADNQRLRMQLSNLETNAGYQLFAWLGDGTNATYVGPIGSSANGQARLDYWSVASRQGFHAGRGHAPLPAVLNPVSQIRALTVTDASTQAVMTADFTMPDRLEYLVKRRFNNDGVEPSAQGTLRLHSNVSSARVRVAVAGLTATNDYFLAVNGMTVMTNATGSRGRLVFDGALQNPAGILDVHRIAVWNSAGTSVLSVTLP